MGTENETPDENDDEEVEEESSNSEDSALIKDLRKQLRAKDRELRDLRPLKETNAYLEAGLSGLSEDHKVALKAVVGDDFSKDNLLAKAKLLGFQVTEGVSTEQQKQEEQIQGEVQTINQTESAINKPTAKPDNRDFITRLREAKSQREAMALITAEGEEHGLLVEEE